MHSEFTKVPRTYVLLTIVIFTPLTWAFISVNNFYPVPVWSLFSEAVTLQDGRTYYVLGGERLDGSKVQIPAISLTDGLTGRNHMMVYYVVGNASFEIDSPHPANVTLQCHMAAMNQELPKAARMDDLLHAWGAIYNERHAGDARLHVIFIDEYNWRGGKFVNYRNFKRRWEVKLN